MLFLLVALLALHATTSSSPPSSPSSHRVQYGYSFSLSTFNPEGRLLQLDYAQAAASQGTPSLAFISPNASVHILSPLELPTSLHTNSLVPKITSLTPSITATYSGLGSDFLYVLAQARHIIVKYRLLYDEDPPPRVYAQAVATVLQEHTMKPNVRPLGIKVLIGGIEDDGTPALYAVDAGGGIAHETGVMFSGDWGGEVPAAPSSLDEACKLLEKHARAKAERDGTHVGKLIVGRLTSQESVIEARDVSPLV